MTYRFFWPTSELISLKTIGADFRSQPCRDLAMHLFFPKALKILGHLA